MIATAALPMPMTAPTLPAATDSQEAERRLVERAAAGDRLAFERLYRLHVGRVFATVKRLVGGQVARAEELTQDAFVRAWRKLPEFRFESAFGTWLYRLAVNTALMDLRSRSGAEDLEDELDATAADVLPAPTSRTDVRIDLGRAVAALPPRARAVLVLHDVEGWRHEEIGTELGIAIGTSKATLHRARRLLREELGEHHE